MYAAPAVSSSPIAVSARQQQQQQIIVQQQQLQQQQQQLITLQQQLIQQQELIQRLLALPDQLNLEWEGGDEYDAYYSPPVRTPPPTSSPTPYVLPFGWGFKAINLTSFVARPLSYSSNNSSITSNSISNSGSGNGVTVLNRASAAASRGNSSANVPLSQLHAALLHSSSVPSASTIMQNLTKPVVVSFDFDGTLHDLAAGREVGTPYPQVLDFLKQFGEAGAQVIITTARVTEDNPVIETFLARNGVAQYVTQIYNTETSDKTASLIAAGAQIHVDDRAPNLDALRSNPNLKLFKVTNGVVSSY